MNARNPLNRANAGTFGQGCDYRGLLFGAEYVCLSLNVLQNVRLVKNFLCYNFTYGRAMSNKAIKQPKPKKQRQKAGRKTPRISTLGVTLGVATLLGGIVAVIALFPRLSVSNDSPIDPNDPFSTPFRVVNDGYVPLFSVRFFMRDIDIKGENGGGRIAGEAYAEDWHAAVFWPTDGIDLYAGRVISSQLLTSAELDVVVKYYVLVKRERVFRFATQLGPDGKLHWMRRPGN